MSEARDILLDCLREFFAPGSEISFKRLGIAAELWRSDGQFFSAGIAMSCSVRAAWGCPEQMAKAQNAALGDFHYSLSQSAPNSYEALAALHKLHGELTRVCWLFEIDRAAVRTQIHQLEEELAQRLLTHYARSEHADNYLVRGVRLSTDLDGGWMAEYPDYELPLGTEHFGERLILHIPSAFHLFIARGDWHGAREIIERRSAAFTQPGLEGWRAVALAYIKPARAMEWFDVAANAFAKDKQPDNEALLVGGGWSSINERLWAKYFRARARLLEAIRYPDKVRELLDSAASCLKGTELGWHSGQVSRLRILIDTLLKLISDPSSLSAEQVEKEYLSEVRLSEDEEYDVFARRFIVDAIEALRGFASDPVNELTKDRLSTAIEALGLVPLIGPEVASVVRTSMGQSALKMLHGQIRTWMHRTLESITDEATFRKILLRLLQAGLPLYSQIRHGPIEYGKDVVALVKEHGAFVLRLYQAKCGDLDKRKWRESKDELEEMFLLPIESLHLPVQPTAIKGFLVTTGHANIFVEPVIEAWFQKQRETHAWDITFLHLDRLVDWLVNDRLINEFKLALLEQGIPIAEDS